MFPKESIPHLLAMPFSFAAVIFVRPQYLVGGNRVDHNLVSTFPLPSHTNDFNPCTLHIYYPLPVCKRMLSQQHSRQHHTCHRPRQGREQRTCQGIPRLRHLRRQEIDAHGVENCLRAAHQNGGQHPCIGIRPCCFEYIQHQPRGS